jgi:hypothetical protein
MNNPGTAFPVSPGELTAEWLSGALRAAGATMRATVTSFTHERIGEGVGFLGEIARITPAYDIAEPDAPRSLIAKFPTPIESAREMAALYGVYACEVRFYEHLADDVSLRTPRCYFSALSPDCKTFLLLLEDLGASGRMGDQVAGCSLNDARLALRELAGFHAQWWDHPRLDALAWLPMGTDLGRTSMSQAYPVGWQTCRDQFGHVLTPEQCDALPDLNERVLRILDQFEGGPLTIMHADYRLDNMFFGGAGAGYDLAVIDWQIANRGWGLYDVAYFTGTNLDSEQRRQHEMTLLREYHDALTSARSGGTPYTWDDCLLHYRMSMAALFANMVGNLASLDMANERGVALFSLIVGRAAAAAHDLESLDTLS